MNALLNTPVSTSTASTGDPIPGMLSNVASIRRNSVPTNANHANIQPVYEVFANVQARDLGSVSESLRGVVADLEKQLSPGNSIEITGQIPSMNGAFNNMETGLLFAAIFVYMLMVLNYQNFGDPLVVILALPATFCGILTMLFITGTTLSVPSLMGAIMAIGVASANSILLVTFAREQQLAGMPAFDAAIAAGRTRMRPVLMTAMAMIVGMVPMAIGGPGEEQNAALARAVIGDSSLRLRPRCSSSLTFSPFCAKAMTAKRRAAFSRRNFDGVSRSGGGDEHRGRRAAARRLGRRSSFSMERNTKARLFGLAALLLVLGAFVRGVWSHYEQRRQAVAEAQMRRDFVPTVRVEAVRESESVMHVTWPGTTLAYNRRTSTHGPRVISAPQCRYRQQGARGDVLAIIAAPDLDQQLAQARAQLIQMQASVEQAKATAELGRVTSSRSSKLFIQDSVSKQQADNDRLTYASQKASTAVAEANVVAQQAAVDRLVQLTGFERVMAPFDGTVTARFIDVGAFVQGDDVSGTFLFTMMHSNVIRIQTYVPQDQAFGLTAGVEAVIRVPEIPKRDFPGKVTRVAGALAPGTRTLLTEIDVPNPDGADSGNLLRRRVADSAQNGLCDGAGPRHHLQPKWIAGGGRAK